VNYSLRGDQGPGGRSYRIRCVLAEHRPELVKQILDIDMMTFSVPTFSRYTAGLMLRHGRTYLLLADDEVIGTCEVIRSFDRPSEGVIVSKSVRPGWRGRGLGTRFLNEVIALLEQAGLHSVLLYVSPTNHHGVRIYEERFGFEKAGEATGEFGAGEDWLVLRRVLQAPSTAQATSLQD